MAVKHFCDICGAEITATNEATSTRSASRLGGEVIRSGKPRLEFEVTTALDGAWNGGDVCKYCIIDAVNGLDDRPRCAPGL